MKNLYLQNKFDEMFSTKIKNYLLKASASKALSLYRVLFALLMFNQYFKFSKRVSFYKDPDYLFFPYPELDWLAVGSYPILLFILLIGILSNIGTLLGVFFRWTTLINSVCYFILFAQDSVYFNNHYYLMALLCFLLSFTGADGSISLTKNKKALIPRWHYVILQLMVGIVFFYGGLSKLNTDWFSGRILAGMDLPGSIVQFLIYSGAFFDLLIPFFLVWKRTRIVALALVIAFNITNHFLFNDIASFPVLMIATLLVFFDSNMGISILDTWQNKGITKKIKTAFTTHSNALIIIILGIFFFLQLGLPLRHHLIQGHPDWTGQGHYFAWRMKSYKKEVSVDFYAFDKSNNTRLYKINHGLDDYTIQRSTAMPFMPLIIAKNLKKKINKMDGFNPNLGISMDYKAVLNGHPEQYGINPQADVSEVKYRAMGVNDWIFPFKNSKYLSK